VFLLKTKERILKTKLRGAVLLLVMTVMFMLMIILMATLAVVSTSNKKAYVKFEENQAYYSAASALEVFWGGENGTNGFMKDEKYFDMNPDGTVNAAVDIDGTSVAMTQGRGIELELYKLETLTSLNVASNITKTNGAPYQFDVILQNNNLPGALGTNPTYAAQFRLPSNPDTEVAYYVEFPTITNPNGGVDSYGEYADINPLNPDPTAPVDDQPLQKASIKMEVLERYYNIDGVEFNELAEFIKDTTGTIHAPSAIAVSTDLSSPDSYKIDLTELANRIQTGERARDYFRVRITSESVLMGVKGTAAVEMLTAIPISAVPQADTAIKSFGWTDDAGAGYNAVGGATGLADIKIGKGNTAGLLYSEGNISMVSTGKITMENSVSPDEKEAKANLAAKSWFIVNNDMNFNIQGDDAFAYGYRGIVLKGNINTGAKSLHLVSNGPIIYNNSYTIPGNVVARQFGQAGTFNKDVDFTVAQGAYIHDFYLDDIKADGRADASTRYGQTQSKFKVQGNSGVLYINNLYLNFPATRAAAAPTGVFAGSTVTGFNPTSEPTFGDYDFYNSGEAGNPGPTGIKTADGDQWLIKFQMSGISKIVISGNLYFRNYNGTPDPDDDYYTPRTYDSVKNYITFINTDTFSNAGAMLAGGTDPNQQYYNYNTSLKANDGFITYAPASDSMYSGALSHAFDINTDIYNARNESTPGSYELYNYMEDPMQIADDLQNPWNNSYSFDSKNGYVWIRMPFSLKGDATPFVLKFDTPMSLYKEYFDASAVYNTADAPIDRDGDGYLTHIPGSDPATTDVLGYGMLLNYYCGAYRTAQDGSYILEDPDDLMQRTTDGQGNVQQNFGYLPHHLEGGVQWGIGDLVLSSEERTDMNPSGWVFSDSDIPYTGPAQNPPAPTGSTMQVPSDPNLPVSTTRRTVGYTKWIDSDGTSTSTNGISYNNINNGSIVNIVDATTVGRNILLQPYTNPYDTYSPPTIVGTYVVDGDEPTNFIIPPNLGTVQLGINQTQSFNIISSRHMKNFNIGANLKTAQENVANNQSIIRYTQNISGLTQNGTIKTGTQESSPDYCSYITLYIGEGTNVKLDSGIIDGTVYGPLSSFSTIADNPTQMGVSFNNESLGQSQPTAILGTVICGSLSFSNNTQIVFLPPDPGNPANPGLPNFTWRAALYTANASGSAT
jgi:hypothetical protein